MGIHAGLRTRFHIRLPDNELTAFAGQNAAFTATLQAENGFSSAVNLSCTRAGYSAAAVLYSSSRFGDTGQFQAPPSA